MTEAESSEERNELKKSETFERNNPSTITTRQSILLNNDMKYFKNELLKEMKKIKQELFAKFSEYALEMSDKIKKASLDNQQLDEKIEYISKNLDNKISAFLSEKNRYNLDRMITDIRDNIITNDIKIQTMREELRVHKDQYEDVVRGNIYYQGMIGPGCKYRNMHQFIDYLISSLNNLTTQLNQKNSEMRTFKNKIEGMFHNINSQISEIIMGYKSYVNQSMKDFDGKIHNDLQLYDEKLIELRAQNMQNTKDIQTKLNNYDDKYKSLDNLENTINECNGKILEDIKESNIKLNQMFEDHKKEYEELKNNYNDLLNYSKDINEKLKKLNIYYKKNIFDTKKKEKKIEPKKESIDNQNGVEFDLKNKKCKNQSTETLGDNFNNSDKKINNRDNYPPANPVSKIFLRMRRGKNKRLGSQKILKNERLEKFNFLYGDNNINENFMFNKSLDNVRSSSFDNGLNKSQHRINSSNPALRSKKNKGKNKVENYTSRDLYDSGLFVNFNSKGEEDNYINNLRNNALCLKLLEKGIKIDDNYINEYINKGPNFPGDYFYNSKTIQKEKYNSLKQFGKEKNFFNMSFTKKGNNKLEENKFHEYVQKGENDTAFLIKNQQNEFFFRNPQNKIKIKNLSAIE